MEIVSAGRGGVATRAPPGPLPAGVTYVFLPGPGKPQACTGHEAQSPSSSRSSSREPSTSRMRWQLSSRGGRELRHEVGLGPQQSSNGLPIDSVRSTRRPARGSLVEPVFTMADQSMIERGMRRLEARGAGAVVVVRVFGLSRASAPESSGCWEWTSRDPAPPMPGTGAVTRANPTGKGATAGTDRPLRLGASGPAFPSPRWEVSRATLIARALLDRARSIPPACYWDHRDEGNSRLSYKGHRYRRGHRHRSQTLPIPSVELPKPRNSPPFSNVPLAVFDGGARASRGAISVAAAYPTGLAVVSAEPVRGISLQLIRCCLLRSTIS